MEKVIKDGKVAVAISPDFGAGWTTWNSDISPFEPKVIEMIEDNKADLINKKWCEENLGIKNVYCGGADSLQVVWLPVGTKFSINEFDGSESIYRHDELEFTA